MDRLDGVSEDSGVQLDQRLALRPARLLDPAVGHFRDRCLRNADQLSELVLGQPAVEKVLDD